MTELVWTSEVQERHKAKETPSLADLHWIAGFTEGEGSFGFYGGTECVQVSQVDTEPLAKLKRLLGGSVNMKDEPRGNRQQSFSWMATGARARGVMLTLYPLLSLRRQEQIAKALRKGI